MKTKYIYYLASIAMTVLFTWSCQKEYEAPTGEPNHEYVTTSAGDQYVRIQVNGEADFIDLSRGVKERLWTFPENIVDIVGSDNDLTSTDQVVKAIFFQPGVFEVNLKQTYADMVFVWDSMTGSNQYDTNILVTVLDSVRANFEARRVIEQTVLVNEDDALNQVMAGREVVLVNRSTGQPETVVWVIERDNGFQWMLQGDSVGTIFSSLGKYNIYLQVSNEFGGDMISYQNWVEAIPSTDPVEFFGVTSVDGDLYLKFSRDIANPSTCPTTAFSLSVRNGLNFYPVNVSNISLDPLQNNIVILELDAPIYNSDAIELTYDNTIGNLESADGYKVDSIVDEGVVFITPNLLAETDYDYSFENYDEKFWRTAGWGTPFTQSYLVGMSGDVVYDGELSAQFVLPVDSGSATILYTGEFGITKVIFPLQKDVDYRVSAWVYIESMGDINWAEPNVPGMRLYSISDGGTFSSDYFIATMDPEFPEGKWVYGSHDFTVPETDNYALILRPHNPNNAQEFRFYMDNISISVLEIRP